VATAAAVGGRSAAALEPPEENPLQTLDKSVAALDVPARARPPPATPELPGGAAASIPFSALPRSVCDPSSLLPRRGGLPASGAALSLLDGTSSEVEEALRAAAVAEDEASLLLPLLLPATAVPAAEAAATGVAEVAAGLAPLALGLLRERHKLVNEVEREAFPLALVLLLAPLAADPELGVAADTAAAAAWPVFTVTGAGAEASGAGTGTDADAAVSAVAASTAVAAVASPVDAGSASATPGAAAAATGVATPAGTIEKLSSPAVAAAGRGLSAAAAAFVVETEAAIAELSPTCSPAAHEDAEADRDDSATLFGRAVAGAAVETAGDAETAPAAAGAAASVGTPTTNATDPTSATCRAAGLALAERSTRDSPIPSELPRDRRALGCTPCEAPAAPTPPPTPRDEDDATMPVGSTPDPLLPPRPRERGPPPPCEYAIAAWNSAALSAHSSNVSERSLLKLPRLLLRASASG